MVIKHSYFLIFPCKRLTVTKVARFKVIIFPADKMSGLRVPSINKQIPLRIDVSWQFIFCSHEHLILYHSDENIDEESSLL